MRTQSLTWLLGQIASDTRAGFPDCSRGGFHQIHAHGVTLGAGPLHSFFSHELSVCCGVCPSVRLAPQTKKRTKGKATKAKAKVALEVTQISADEQDEQEALAAVAGSVQETAAADAAFVDAAWDAVGWQVGADGEVVDFQVSDRPGGHKVWDAVRGGVGLPSSLVVHAGTLLPHLQLVELRANVAASDWLRSLVASACVVTCVDSSSSRSRLRRTRRQRKRRWSRPHPATAPLSTRWPRSSPSPQGPRTAGGWTVRRTSTGPPAPASCRYASQA